MRKTLPFLLVLSLAFPSTVFAVPSMRGRRGILRVLSARTTPMAELCVNLHGEHAQGQYPTTAVIDTVTLPVVDWHLYPRLHTGITYGVVDFLEFSVLGNFYCKYDQSDSLPDEYSIGLEDAELGIKLGGPIAQDPERGLAWVQGIHAYGTLTRPHPPHDDSLLVRKGFKPYYPHYPSPDAGVDLLTDLEVSPLSLRLNVGYFRPGNHKPEYEPPEYRRNQVRWGAGLEIEAGPYVRFLTEVAGRKLLDEDPFPPDTMWITPGIRFITPAGVSFDFGCDFALGEDFDWVPDDSAGQDYRNENTNWNAIVGITITSSLRKPPEPVPIATLTGKITDAETGEPLGAEISFPRTSYEAVTADLETGLYKVSLKPGIVRVHVSKAGYRWKEKPITLKRDKTEVLDFELTKKKVPEGIVTGKVTDVKTEKPLGAKISFPDTKFPLAASDMETGIYKATIPPGTYTAKAEAEGYASQTLPVVVKDKETSFLNFGLMKKTASAGIVTGKVTDANTGKPVGAKVSFPDAKLPFVASDMETGIYKATIPPGTYTAKAEAQGYASETLPVVVKEKETAFLNFELRPKLVVGARIVLRGINFDTGSATIRPESYPILDQAAETLKANPTVRVEIGGHTDSVGSASYNQRLSEARAASVRSHLISAGIASNRLVSRGYGEARPMASNKTSAGRQLNRRIEFLILGR